MYVNQAASLIASRASHARPGHCWQAALAVIMGLYRADPQLNPDKYRYVEGVLAHPQVRPIFHGWVTHTEPGNEHIIDPLYIYFNPHPVFEDYLPIAEYSFEEATRRLREMLEGDVISIPFIDFESKAAKAVAKKGELRSGKTIDATRVISVLRGP